jgi:predicted DNA-binding transcriptional regulator AlpA
MEYSPVKALSESSTSRQSRLANAMALADRLADLTNLAVPVWLDIHEITSLTGLSESSIRRMGEISEFPHLNRIGPRRRGITLHAYLDWSKRCEQAGAP